MTPATIVTTTSTTIPQPIPTSPSRTDVGCPRCGCAELGCIAGYAFTSCPDPTPTWEEFCWCDNCGWSEDWSDGQIISFSPSLPATSTPITSDFDSDIPPF